MHGQLSSVCEVCQHQVRRGGFLSILQTVKDLKKNPKVSICTLSDTMAIQGQSITSSHCLMRYKQILPLNEASSTLLFLSYLKLEKLQLLGH